MGGVGGMGARGVAVRSRVRVRVRARTAAFSSSFSVSLDLAVSPATPVAVAVPTIEVYGPHEETTRGSSTSSKTSSE